MKAKHLISILIISILFSSCGMNSIEGMKDNIDEKSSEIIDLKNYFDKIVPENYIVRIQYNSSNNVDLFVYETVRDSTERENLFGQWDVSIDNYKETPQTDYEKEYGGKTKSLEVVKSKLNWTRELILMYLKMDFRLMMYWGCFFFAPNFISPCSPYFLFNEKVCQISTLLVNPPMDKQM
jgi:hypothetical protein